MYLIFKDSCYCTLMYVSVHPPDMAEVETNLTKMTEALAEKEAELVDITARHNLKIRDAEEKIGDLEKEVEKVKEMLKEETAAKEAAEEQISKLNTELTAARQGK